jgi:hypothetical protein
LDLPPITPRPPLPKRAYDALLSHFTKALLPRSASSASASTAAVANQIVYSATVSSQLQSVSKSSSKLAERTSEIINNVTDSLRVPRANPSIKAGVAAILELNGLNEEEKEELWAVVAAVVLVAFEKMAGDGMMLVGPTGWSWRRGKDYPNKRRMVIAAVTECGKKVTKPRAPVVDRWVVKLSEEGVKKWDWIKEIPDANSGEIPTATVAATPSRLPAPPQCRVAKRKSRISAAAGGGGRMLQEKVDYLNDKHRRDFIVWKEDVLRRCTLREAGEL